MLILASIAGIGSNSPPKKTNNNNTTTWISKYNCRTVCETGVIWLVNCFYLQLWVYQYVYQYQYLAIYVVATIYTIEYVEDKNVK